MDEIDIASEREQIDTQRAIDAARKSPKIEATGNCLFCGDTVEKDMRWCSPECRDDWEMRN